MTNPLQLLAVATNLILLLAVLDLVRRGKLREEYSFIWLACAGALLVLSLWREILHAVARWLGVHYPPSVLLLVLIVFVFAASLQFSVVLSRQRAQIERLVEELAILSAEQREREGPPPRRAEPPGVSAPDPGPGPAQSPSP